MALRLVHNFLRRRVSDRATGLIAAVGVAMIAICVCRAAIQPIAHDEAITYLLFIAGPWRRAMAYTGNQNHILLVLVDKLTLLLLPASAFTLRLPVIATAVLYCAAAAALLRRFVAAPWLRVAGFAVLTLNAYVLDYFSEARGYGMMIAFLLAATWRLIPRYGERLATRSALEGGLLIGLAMAAVPVAAFPAAGILAACAVFEAFESGWPRALGRAMLVAAAGAMIATPLLFPQMYHAKRADYYVGARTIAAWIGSLVKAGWSHRSPHVESMAELTASEWIVFAVSIAIVAATIVVAARALWRWQTATDTERGLTWNAIVMAVMAAVAVLAHLVIGIRYPDGRIALYWLPPMILAAILLVSIASSTGWRYTGGLLIAAMLANTAVHVTATRYADNWFDAANRQAIDTIVRDHASTARPVTIGGSWIFEPALNFYRVTRGLDWMAPVERRPPARGDDYYVLLREDAGFVDTLGLRVLFQDPAVGTTVAVPRARR
jgi:hypothetical protein